MITIEMGTRVIAENARGGAFTGILKGFTAGGYLIILVDQVNIGHGWESVDKEIMSFPRDLVREAKGE